MARSGDARGNETERCALETERCAPETESTRRKGEMRVRSIRVEGGEWDRPRLHGHVHALALRRSVAELEDEAVAHARAELTRRVRLVRGGGRGVSEIGRAHV